MTGLRYSDTMAQEVSRLSNLRWQSQALLLAVVPACSIWALLQALRLWPEDPARILWALSISSAFALVVRLARAATPVGALTGGLLACCLYLFVPGPRTALWPLFAMLLLTLGASRVGRARKLALGTAEGRRGRSASQVAANLGAAALAVLLVKTQGKVAAEVVMLAALAEAAADTLASELGEVFGGTPRLITTWRPVLPGTDGGITLSGTLAGFAGAAVVATTGAAVLRLGLRGGAIALTAGVFGLVIDSLLGALAERRGWLNNDAVNFLSTLAAQACCLIALAP